MTTAASDAVAPSQNAPFTVSGSLPTLGLLQVAGPDAASFLQGQLSNDTRRLSHGDQTQLTAYSTPQGRVLCVMTLLPHANGILAILPRTLLEATAARLRKFVLRAKVKLDLPAEEVMSIAVEHDESALQAAGMAIPTAANGYRETAGIGVARRGAARRFYLVGPPAELAARGFGRDGISTEQVDNAWRLADIRAGLPQIYPQTSEIFVAQMLNLDLLDGISFTKGCYTGQEIIARTQHLGRIKRRMYRLRLPLGDWRIGQALRLEDGRTGRLVDWAHDPVSSAIEALAVLTLETVGDGGGEAETVHSGAEELALPYSLGTNAT